MHEFGEKGKGLFIYRLYRFRIMVDSAVNSLSLWNTPKIHNPFPFAIPGQSQNTPVRGSIFQKTPEVCSSVFPVTVQHSRHLPLIYAWLVMSPQFPDPSALPLCFPGRFPSGSPLDYYSFQSKIVGHLLTPNHMAPPCTQDFIQIPLLHSCLPRGCHLLLTLLPMGWPFYTISNFMAATFSSLSPPLF